MLTMLLVAVAVPVLTALILILLPRSPWVAVGPAADQHLRVVPGTAALALGGAFALSVWLQEGTTAPWSQWHTVPAIIGGYAVLSMLRGSHERKAGGMFGCFAAPFMALVAGLLVVFMRFPGWTTGDRALAALAAIPVAFVLCASMGAAPATSSVIGAVALGAMASLCMASGFAKLALALAAAATVLLLMAFLCAGNRRLTPGVGSATLVAALLAGSAAAGQSYDYATFPAHWWWVVALAPIAPILTVPLVGTVSSSRTAAVTKVAVVVLVCLVAVVSAWGAKRAAGESIAAHPPCTEPCFLRHCAHG
ncbi:MAG: hypothetical protein ACO3DS_02200 [Phycisphaerales bacterium]